MTKPASLTVVLLTCNRSGFIRQALQGLIRQTFDDWQLLASDCSDDPQIRAEVAQIMKDHRYGDSLHETIILQQPAKISQGEHLRRALSAVNTPFVALLDDDDIWLPPHLKRAYTWLQEDPVHGLAIADFRVIDEDGRIDSRDRHTPLPPAPTDRQGWLGLELRSFYSSTSSFVFRVEAIAGHQFFTTSMVDVHLAISILLNGYQVIGFPEQTLLYRVHAGSSYRKGGQVLIDRYQMRLWLFWHQGWRITRQYPLFPLLVIKSVVGLLYFRFLKNESF